MKKSKVLAIAFIVWGLLILSFPAHCQKKKDSTATKVVADTSKGIKYEDIVQYNDWLAKSISYAEYVKLTPDAILAGLWNWFVRKNKKP